LPPGAIQPRTAQAALGIEAYLQDPKTKGVAGFYTVAGQGGGGSSGQNAGRGFILLSPWDERTGVDLSADTLTKKWTRDITDRLRNVEFLVLSTASVHGLGQSNGFTIQLLNTGGLGRADFKVRRDALVLAAQDDPGLGAVRLGSLENNPTLKVDIDDEKIGALGLTSTQVDQATQ
jgi:multidrug efflux pump